MLAITTKWFPQHEPDEQTIAKALWLENDHWQKMQIAIANGIARAFSGK